MNTIFSARITKHLTLTTALCTAFISAAYADDLDIETIIPGVPQINTESYILIGYDSGKILAEQNTDICRSSVNLTKVMTGYIIDQAMKTDKLKETDLVTISDGAWTTNNPVFKGSLPMFLKPGMQVPVSQLIHSISLQSGDDACVVMTDFVAGSQDIFAGLVNNYANVLSLKNTHFQTVHSLDTDGQYSSVQDMALIGQALIRNVPNEYLIHKEKGFASSSIRQLNRNGLLWDDSLNADDIETEHTDRAGYNLVASATEGQMRLISMMMGGHTLRGREAESRKLLTWGFRFFETVNPLRVGKEFASEPVWLGDSDRTSLGVDEDVHLTIPHDRMEGLKVGYVLNSNGLYAPPQKNQVVGTINLQLDSKTAERRLLVMLQEIPKGNFFGKIIDCIKLMFHHWFG